MNLPIKSLVSIAALAVSVYSFTSTTFAASPEFLLSQTSYSDLLRLDIGQIGQIFKPTNSGLVDKVTVLCSTSGSTKANDSEAHIYEWLGGPEGDNPDLFKGALVATSKSITNFLPSICYPTRDLTYEFEGPSEVFLSNNNYYFIEFTKAVGYISVGLSGSSDGSLIDGSAWAEYYNQGWFNPPYYSQVKDLYLKIHRVNDGRITVIAPADGTILGSTNVMWEVNYTEPDSNAFNTIRLSVEDFYTNESVQYFDINLGPEDQTIGQHTIARTLTITRPGYFKATAQLLDCNTNPCVQGVVSKIARFSIKGAPLSSNLLLNQIAYDGGLRLDLGRVGQVFKPVNAGMVDNISFMCGTSGSGSASTRLRIYQWLGNPEDDHPDNLKGALLATSDQLTLQSSSCYPQHRDATYEFSGENEIYLSSTNYYYLEFDQFPYYMTVAAEGSSNNSLIDGVAWAEYDFYGGWFSPPTYSQVKDLYLIIKNKNFSPSITNLNQYKSDGVTQISEGSIATEDIVTFKAVLTDADSDQVKLQVELRQIGEPFTGMDDGGILSSDFTSSGSTITLTRANLIDAEYHWRAGAVDDKGNTSPWQEFGVTGNTDFEIDFTIDIAVILAQANNKFLVSDRSYFENIISKQAVDYWCEVSFGTRLFSGECIKGLVALNFEFFDNNGEKYELDHPIEYYGTEIPVDVDDDGSSDYTYDRTDLFIEDGIRAAHKDIPNYSVYEAVMVIYPGDYCSGDTCIYNSYHPRDEALFEDPNDRAKNWIAVAENSLVGSWAHEIGHALGNILTTEGHLCDLYDDARSCRYGGFDILTWDLMARGSIAGDPQGSKPTQLSSFSRQALKWLDTEDVRYGNYTLGSLETIKMGETAKQFIISSTNKYIFEARIKNTNLSNWDHELKTNDGFNEALVVYEVNQDQLLDGTPFKLLSRIKTLNPLNDSFVDEENNLEIRANGVVTDLSNKKLSINSLLSFYKQPNRRGVILQPSNSLLKKTWKFSNFLTEWQHKITPRQSKETNSPVFVTVEKDKYNLKKDYDFWAILSNDSDVPVYFARYPDFIQINEDGKWRYLIPSSETGGIPDDATNIFIKLGSGQTYRSEKSAFAYELGYSIRKPGTYRIAIPYTTKWFENWVTDISNYKVAYSDEFIVESEKSVDVEQSSDKSVDTPFLPLPVEETSFWDKFVSGLQRILINIFDFMSGFWKGQESSLPATARLYLPYHTEIPPGFEDVEQYSVDLDLHTYTTDGKHTGVNYETGEYENQIPGATASGDVWGGKEWIYLPVDIEANYIVSSHDTEKFLEQQPLIAGQIADSTDSYQISAKYVDADMNTFVSLQMSSIIINPGENIIHQIFGTTTPAVSPGKVYNFSGFLPPLRVDSSGIYKQGRNLPIKFQITGQSGQFVADAAAKLSIAKVQDGIVGTDEIPLSTSNADTGNFFRYDSQANQYIYNLSTDTITIGTWQLKVSLDDGREYFVKVSIK